MSKHYLETTTPRDATPRRRSALQAAPIGALAATVANVALLAGGRAADVGFQVSPPSARTSRSGSS